MGSPRSNYRAVCVLLPSAAALGLAAAVTGNWLVVAGTCFAGLGAALNLRAMRRRGIGWNWPSSYRELRSAKRE